MLIGLASPLLCCLILLVGAGLATAQAPDGTYDLAIGHSVSFDLLPGSPVGVRIDFRGSRAEEILVQTAGPDIAYRIVSGNGIQIRSGRAETTGWLVLSLAAMGEKQVLLWLSADASSTNQMPFRVRVDGLRILSDTLASHAKAAELHSAAQVLHNSLHAEDVKDSIAKFQEAATEWGNSGDLYGEAIALGGEAESQFELSRYSEATHTLDRAINLNLKNTYLRAWLDHLEARAFLDEWESKPAERYANESLSLGEAIKEPALIADALADLAEANYWKSNKLADSYAEDALVRARATGLPRTVAYCLRVQAFLEEELGHLPRALSLMTEAEAFFRQAGDLRLALESTEYLTSIEGRAGDDFGALMHFAELEPVSKETGNLVDYGILIQNIGNEYVILNRLATARSYFQLAREAYARAHFKSGESMSQGKICGVELRSQKQSDGKGFGVLKSALSNCETSVAITEQIQDPYRIAIAKYQVGLVHQRMAVVDRRRKFIQLALLEDRRALDIFKVATMMSQSVDDKRTEEQERISLGEVLEDIGNGQEARSEFETAQSLSEEENNSDGVLEARYHIAHLYAEDGQNEVANETLKPALEQIEAARRSVSDSTLQASYFAAERKCFVLGVELRMREYQHNPVTGGDVQALEMSEASRARGLLDALVAHAVPDSAESGDTEADLMQSNAIVDQVFGQRLKLMLEGGSKRELEGNSSKLTMALDALARAEDAVQTSASRTSQFARTLTAAEIERASASSNATYFEFALGETHSYLWVIDRGVLKSYVLPPRDQIEGMVKKWQAFVTSGDEAAASPSNGRSQPGSSKDFQRLSAKLSCVLLGNVVEPRMTRLIIVPDGDLVMLPFTALPENGCSSSHGTPLLTAHEIILTPSLSVFLSRKTAVDYSYKGEVAVVADPVFDRDDARFLNAPSHSSSLTKSQFSKTDASLPRLLNTGFEAKAIRETVGINQVYMAVGFDASVKTVLGAKMQDYRIWHLATHGIYDESTPEFSGLVFSLVSNDGSPQFGFLKAQDIAYLHIHPELVILSACDSAAGENLSGEGAMGLSYSFLRAGARNVVSTLWNVDDSISEELMADFYIEMMRNGDNAVDALRQSQLAVMRNHQNSSPYYWAGFELTSVGN